MAKLANNKTRLTEQSVEEFIDNIPNDEMKKDSRAIVKMMKKATGEKPKIWGSSLIGFGYVIIKSPSGREVEWFRIGFGPRKANLSIYLMHGIKRYVDLLKKLGKHKTGDGCLYINKLSDVDSKVLEELIDKTVNEVSK